MKKSTTTLLLATILLLSLALPALASPTGASPSDIALWQTQHPAPCGEFQKTYDLLGPDAAAPVIARRLAQSQRGAVIDNTPRGIPLQIILRYTTIDQLEAMFAGEIRWGSMSIWTGDIIKYTTGGQTSYLVYDGSPMNYYGDQTAFRAQPTSPLPSNIPIYSEQAYQNGLVQIGNFFEVQGSIFQALWNGIKVQPCNISLNDIFIHPDSE